MSAYEGAKATLDQEAAAAYLNVSIEWLQNRRREGLEPRFTKRRQSVIYSKADLDLFMAHRTFLQQLLDEGERVGIYRKTGEFRKGQPVYVITEFGIKFGKAHPDSDDFDAAYAELLEAQEPTNDE